MKTKTKNRAGRWLGLGAGLVLTAVAIEATLTPAAQGSVPAESVALTDRAPADFERPVLADVIAAAQPAVVTIAIEKSARNPQALSHGGDPRTNEFFERFFGRDFPRSGPQGPVRGVGSGFIVDEDGYVVTNNHVIDGADEIVVTLHDGTENRATLVGTDPKTDLAVLKIDADGLSAATFGNSDAARVGDWVVAIGNPFGFGGSATVGIISARGRDLRAGPYDDFLQIDAPINQGNSGGPVFNTAGQVIGVNTAIYSPNGGNVGIGFAIPAAQAQEIVAELRDRGSVDRGWLGVQLQDMDDALAASFGLTDKSGALVAEVVADSPADEAGVRAGDVIIRFDSEAVDSPKHLSRLVAAADSGTEVVLEVHRDGRRKRLDVALGRPDEPASIASAADGTDTGLALRALDDRARARLGLEPGASGAVIASVAPDSPAAAQGLRSGDVIVGVDRQPVASPRDVDRAVAAARNEGRDAVVLLVRRGAAQRFAALPVA